MGVGLLSLEIQRSCQTSHKQSVLAKERRFEAKNAPESHTLIVPELSPETILLPSGEKSTLGAMEPVSVDPISFRDAEKVGKHRDCQLWPRRGDLGALAAHHPKL